MTSPKMKLRYFNARGRAQFLRAYLHVRGIPFEDDRVPLEDDFASWLAVRDDRSLNGPLKRLPVLTIDDELIPEALVIASYLHRYTGDAAALSEKDNRRCEIIVSSAYTDIMLNLGMLIWADLMYRGADLPSLARSMRDRLDRLLSVLDTTIAEWEWVETMHDRPVTVADCLLWEELDKAMITFGSHLSLDDKPALARFRSEHPEQVRFETLLTETPCQISGRPGEAQSITAIQNALAEAAGGDRH